jgi:hypothetical protein
MSARGWSLLGFFALLLIGYALFFTEWVRPVPIEVASQVRFTLERPRFGRPAKPPTAGGQAGQGNRVVKVDATQSAALPDKEAVDPTPPGVGHVTFSLDAWYRLTRIRVEDIPADGSEPKVLWNVKGKSQPVNSLLYGIVPPGLSPILAELTAEPLQPGVPYRIVLEAGRRRGTNSFMTVALGQGD